MPRPYYVGGVAAGGGRRASRGVEGHVGGLGARACWLLTLTPPGVLK
jgi:hypothetical protein